MRPDVLDEVELLAGVGRKPEHVDPFAKAIHLFERTARGVRRTVVEHQDDLLACTTRSGSQEIEQTDGVFGDRVLPQSVREEERPVRVAKGSADSDSVILARRFDPLRLSSKPIGVGGDGKKIEPHSVSVPQFEIRPRA